MPAAERSWLLRVQQRLVQPAALRRNAASRPTLPRRALILETVADVAGGSHSLPELEYLDGLRRTGLPMPVRQKVVRRQGGRYYLDADFEDYGVTVEINGAQHFEPRAREYDDVRRARLAIGGAGSWWTSGPTPCGTISTWRC